jgi:hypothetical protein
MHLCHFLLVLLIAPLPGPAPASSASPGDPSMQGTTQKPAAQPQKPQPPALDPDDLPVDLDRIQRALARTPRLQFDVGDRPVFRVETFGDKPTIDDILGPDWATGPVKHGAMTHQEFLALVTPKDVTGYAAFSNEEAAAVATTSFVLQWTLQRAIARFRETRDERERAAARREVLEALAALEEARARAGRRKAPHPEIGRIPNPVCTASPHDPAAGGGATASRGVRLQPAATARQARQHVTAATFCATTSFTAAGACWTKTSRTPGASGDP